MAHFFRASRVEMYPSSRCRRFYFALTGLPDFWGRISQGVALGYMDCAPLGLRIFPIRGRARDGVTQWRPLRGRGRGSVVRPATTACAGGLPSLAASFALQEAALERSPPPERKRDMGWRPLRGRGSGSVGRPATTGVRPGPPSTPKKPRRAQPSLGWHRTGCHNAKRKRAGGLARRGGGTFYAVV